MQTVPDLGGRERWDVDMAGNRVKQCKRSVDMAREAMNYAQIEKNA